MKNIAIFLAAATIAACTTPAERRMQRPDLDLTSTRPTKDVAICISEKWENTRPFLSPSSPPVNTKLRADGYSITVTSTNGLGATSTAVLADVLEANQTTRVLFYKQMGGGFGDYDEALKKCI